MNSLEQYLTEEYPADQREIEDVDQLLASIANVYRAPFDATTAWPYIADIEGGKPSDDLSLSTTSMILNALLRLADTYVSADATRSENGLRRLVFPLLQGKKIFDETLVNNLTDAVQIIIAKVRTFAGKTVPTSSGNLDNRKYPHLTESSTYGPNDVFTVAWLADICTSDITSASKEIGKDLRALQRELRKVIAGKLQAFALRNSPSDAARVLFDPQILGVMKPKPSPHAFPVLRLVQAAKRSSIPINQVSVFYKYFENSLHEQLSFSSIPDSRFDPAELAFCLEGMLLCRRKTVDHTIFDRVLAVLTAAQHQSPYWRPVKPFLTTKQGLVLFPVSVEIANSLLRSCALFDGEQLHNTYSSKCMGLFRRYAQWLRARAVHIEQAGKALVGWHSEHVNEADTIHLWETSQVLEFLISYRNALHLHVARTTLVLSRFKQEKAPFQAWPDLEAKYEAVTLLGPTLKVYEQIGRNYVEPLRDNLLRKNYSMLLYGPPGTGKTTVAESIAESLNRRLITITVSDFLAGGQAQLEARAKDIFTVLMAQPSSVIFFDEIDHFLLDRDSIRYNDQETAFQFMTPGMLTKLNDLRRSKNALFIVATNYEDRIDAAIKRAGRIDEKFLVLPPDGQKRSSIISKLLGDLDSAEKATTANLAKLSEASLFLGYTDIEAVLNSVAMDRDWLESAADGLRKRARTISLEAYTSRFILKGDRKNLLDVRATPMREFLCLVALKALHPTLAFSPSEKAVVELAGEVLQITERASTKQWEDALREYASEIADDVIPSVASVIAGSFTS